MSSLKAKLGMDSSDFQKGIAAAESRFERFSSTMSRLFVAGAIGGALKSFIDKFDAIGETAEAAGVSSAAAFKSLESQAEYAGVSTEKFSKGMLELKSAIDGGSSALKNLGIETHTATGAAKSTDEVMYELADAVDKYGASSECSAEITNIFGKKIGPYMTQMLAQGGASLRSGVKDFEAYNDAVNTAAEANDAMQWATEGVTLIIGKAAAALRLMWDLAQDVFGGKGIGDSYHERQIEKERKARKKKIAEEFAAKQKQLEAEAEAAEKASAEEFEAWKKNESERAKATELRLKTDGKVAAALAKEKGFEEEIKLTIEGINGLKKQMSELDDDSLEYAELRDKLADAELRKRDLDNRLAQKITDAEKKAAEEKKKLSDDEIAANKEVNDIIKEREKIINDINKQTKEAQEAIRKLVGTSGGNQDRAAMKRAERFDKRAETELARGNYARAAEYESRANQERADVDERRNRNYKSQLARANRRFGAKDREAEINAINAGASKDAIVSAPKAPQELVEVNKKLTDAVNCLERLTKGLEG